MCPENTQILPTASLGTETVTLEAIVEPFYLSNTIMSIGRGVISIKSIENFIKKIQAIG